MNLAKSIMKVIALSLELAPDAFDALSRVPAAAIRLLHYPPEVEGTGQLFRTYHSPGNCISLLAIWNVHEVADCLL